MTTTETLFKDGSFHTQTSSDISVPFVEENQKKILAAEGLYDPGSGEVCTKYLEMSHSSMLNHPYYRYPALQDPGIEMALMGPDLVKSYNDDGQELYLDTCCEMRITPVREFYRGLLGDEINLRYYGLNPACVRSMCIALRKNRTVKSWVLADNQLSDDACFHLGELLLNSMMLMNLDLAGCKIGASGVRRLLHTIAYNNSLKQLNLSRNNLGDGGVEMLSQLLSENNSLERLNLSYNKLAQKSALALAKGLEDNNRLTHLDLSWNRLYTEFETYRLLRHLSEIASLQEVNLSWNALSGVRLAQGLQYLMKATALHVLNLSNNRLSMDAIDLIVAVLPKTTRLRILDLSFNPISAEDAIKLVSVMTSRRLKLSEMRLDGVRVNSEFVEIRDRIMAMDYKAGTIITFGSVRPDPKPPQTDLREIILRRIHFLCTKTKKKAMKKDFGLFALTLKEELGRIVFIKEFMAILPKNGFKLPQEIVQQLPDVFPGPPAKEKSINFEDLADYVKRLWPETKLPKPPPPDPEPEPEITTKVQNKEKKGKKNKKKKKKK